MTANQTEAGHNGVKTMKLSERMLYALELLREYGGCPDFGDPSLNALARRGLVQWYPYSRVGGFQGNWKLTKEGAFLLQSL